MRKNSRNQQKILKLDTFSQGGGNAVLWTKRSYGQLGSSETCLPKLCPVARFEIFEVSLENYPFYYRCPSCSSPNSLGNVFVTNGFVINFTRNPSDLCDFNRNPVSNQKKQIKRKNNSKQFRETRRFVKQSVGILLYFTVLGGLSCKRFGFFPCFSAFLFHNPVSPDPV